VDFYALVGEFWWVSFPAVMMAGLALVMLTERQEALVTVE
jgi:hypothetical protein